MTDRRVVDPGTPVAVESPTYLAALQVFRFYGARFVDLAARMAGASWVYQGSFSKTFPPGLRLGFLAASEDLFDRFVMAKQAVDLHSSRLSQRIVLEAITDSWNARLTELIAFYRRRRDAFDPALSRHLGTLAQWQMASSSGCVPRSRSTRDSFCPRRSRRESHSCRARSSVPAGPSSAGCD